MLARWGENSCEKESVSPTRTGTLPLSSGEYVSAQSRNDQLTLQKLIYRLIPRADLMFKVTFLFHTLRGLSQALFPPCNDGSDIT